MTTEQTHPDEATPRTLDQSAEAPGAARSAAAARGIRGGDAALLHAISAGRQGDRAPRALYRRGVQGANARNSGAPIEGRMFR